MDWRGAQERLEATAASADLRPLILSMEEGSRIVLVGPGAGIGRTDTEWIRLIHSRHTSWRQRLSAVSRTELVEIVRPQTRNGVAVPFVARVYEVIDPTTSDAARGELAAQVGVAEPDGALDR